MNFIDKILLGFMIYFLIFFFVFLLYQTGKIRLSESSMGHWIRANDVFETILLVLTRFLPFGFWGTFGLGAFYVLSIILLSLQFVFAEFGPGRKILDLMWIGFYVMLFMMDVLDVNVIQTIMQSESSQKAQLIDSFLKNSFLGKIIISIVTPIIRGLIIEAIKKNE